jgi:hypothetical protein
MVVVQISKVGCILKILAVYYPMLSFSYCPYFMAVLQKNPDFAPAGACFQMACNILV